MLQTVTQSFLQSGELWFVVQNNFPAMWGTLSIHVILAFLAIKTLMGLYGWFAANELTILIKSHILNILSL